MNKPQTTDGDVGNAEYCPACLANWIGEEIPEESRQHYGDSTHFQRGPIGVEYSGTTEDYDGVSEWQCPDCGTRWGRWTGRVLADGELEGRFGRLPIRS